MSTLLTDRKLRFDAPHRPSEAPAAVDDAARHIEFVPSPTFAELDQLHRKTSIDDLVAIEPVETRPRTVSLRNISTGLATYLAELQRTPLLDAESEYRLFRWMNYLKYRADRQCGAGSVRSVAKLLRRARTLRNQIVSANLRLVVSIAKKQVDRSNTLDELISEGNLPLIRAAEIFDYERGIKFSTYATWAIRNGLNRSIPRARRKQAFALTGTEELLPNAEDIRDEPRGRESYRSEVRRAVEQLLDQLEERDRQIVTSRFGLNDEDREFRFREIAESLDISTERVRQLLARTLRNLKESNAELSLELV